MPPFSVACHLRAQTLDAVSLLATKTAIDSTRTLRTTSRPKIALGGSLCQASEVRPFEIDSLPIDRMEELQPVWRSLYEHHLGLTPHLRDRAQPFERAWQARRRIEAEWQARGEELSVLAARAEDRYVGYALVRIRSGSDFAATWEASERLAELVILAVLPDWRGQGVGSALLDAVEVRLRELGVKDMVISVVTTNDDAMRLYRRRGAEPFVTELIQRVSPGALGETELEVEDVCEVSSASAGEREDLEHGCATE